MNSKGSRIAVIGCGNVGTNTAYTIAARGLCDELVLIDYVKDKAIAEALDMKDAMAFFNSNMVIRQGDYSDCRDADIVIISASAPMAKDSHSRFEMLKPSLGVVKSCVTSVMESGFDGIFIIISNPVDVMTYYTWKLSGLPAERVIGSGTNLDSARLRTKIGAIYDVDPSSVDIYVLGEHGDSEFAVWDSANLGGKKIRELMKEDPGTGENTEDSLIAATKQAGWDIFNRKGNTCYGIAASTTSIAEAILKNENRIIPVTVRLNGQYGLKDVFLSAPAVLGREGVKSIVEIGFSEEEEAKMKESARTLEEFYEVLENADDR